jgi:DNA polymerase, archaea type
MVVWLKKPDGRCVRLIDRWKPKIHVGGDFRELKELACRPYISQCRFVEKYERPSDPEKSRVLEIEVENDSEAAKLANRIRLEDNYSNFRLYDVDIPSVQVYLYQKAIFPLALVEADENGEEVNWSLKDSREMLDYRLPPLRKTSLQVKTRRTGNIQTFGDRIGAIQVKQDQGEAFTFDSDVEEDIILNLVDYFKSEDPDIVFTNGGDSFIFPYLARRAHENGMLERLVLGRDPSPLRVYEVQGHSYFSYGKILYRDTAARLHGRLHIDSHNAFLSADCGLEGLFEISRTCIIPIQRASRATIGTNMSSLQLYHAIKREVLIPWNKSQPENWKGNEEIVNADRGGFIYAPEAGIHDQVGEIDFTSLYPTIMRDKNLSGETVNCKCCPDSPHRVPELDYNICGRQIGIVPQSLDILLKRRLSFKKLKTEIRDEHMWQRFDQRQSALKWILVCSFGYLGFKNARFGKIDAHIATCAFSRRILDQAVTLAQSQGFRLVHGIVDSMWLSKAHATGADYEALCALLRKDLDIHTSFEGQYKWIVFLNSKTDQQAQVLNRYYGVFQDGKLKVRGIDVRRHDTPEIVRQCQTEMLSILSKADNTGELKAQVPQVLETVREYVSKIQERKVSFEDLVITRSLSKNPEEYSHKVPQALAAQLLKKEGGSVHAGQQVRYILTSEGRRRQDTRATVPELVDENTVYDSKRYVDLLISSAENLLLPFGFDKKSLTNIFGLD